MSKGTWITGRIFGNNGDVAVLETSDNRWLMLTRGHDYGCKDMFRDEFLTKLHVGRRFDLCCTPRGVFFSDDSFEKPRKSRS